MIIKALDDLLVYRKALAASVAVSALLQKEGLRMDWNLRDQLASASAAVPGNIAEGFGQQTDRQFTKYLFIARGSAQEIRSHMAVAHGRKYVSETELLEISQMYEEIARMLSGLAKYLRASDRRERG